MGLRVHRPIGEVHNSQQHSSTEKNGLLTGDFFGFSVRRATAK
jgi:hypothetical protein